MVRRISIFAVLIAAGIFCCSTAIAEAGTTGIISGTVLDANRKPVSNVAVIATAPSLQASATTDAHGFYNLGNLLPDTYTVSFAKQQYEPNSNPGVTVNQDQTTTLNVTLTQKLALIGTVQSASAQGLLHPGQTADVYNITSKQLEAAQGGDNVHKTLYDFTQSVPGVTGAGANAQPRVRGGLATDSSFLYDGVSINDRLTGFFSTNNGYFQTTTISSVGVGNVQVYTGGFDARFGQAAQGVFNSVVKSGTSPGFALVSAAIRGPLFQHALQVEYGGASANRRYSWYFGYDAANSDNQFGDGRFSFPRAAVLNPGQGPGPQNTLDMVANFHYRPNNRDDIQFLIQNGNGLFNGNYLLGGGNPVGVVPCAGVKGYWVPAPPFEVTPPKGSPYPGFHVTNPGIAANGQACVVTPAGTTTAVPTGLQYVALDPNAAQLTYHYSGVGKIQWNHIFNDKLFGYLRLSENFNQYILNQPLNDPNFDKSRIPGSPAPGGSSGLFPQTTRDFFGDRRQQSYVGNAELTWTPNAETKLYGGISHEQDDLLQAYYDRSGTDGYSNPPAAFDALGNWPNEYTLANQPFYINSVYVGAAQKFHKFEIDPSVRYDANTYGLPQVAGGAFFKGGFSPRIAVAYQPRRDLILRASYGVTSTFIPATYIYNNSIDGIQGAGQYRSPYLHGAEANPSIDHNVDFSIEKAFPDGRTSLRLTPYYHQTNNRLEVLRNPQLNPDGSIVVDKNGNPVFLLGSVAKSGGIAKDYGIELGISHVLPGDGLSWFLAATYQSYFSTSFTLAAAAINPQNPKAYFLNNGKGELFRVPDQPPISVSFTGNYNYKRLHFLPYFIWQCCAYYNVQHTGNGFVSDPNIHTSPGYVYGNATLSYDLAREGRRVTRVGMRVTNVFDNEKNNVYPSVNTCYGRSPAQQAGSTVCPSTGYVYDGNLFTFKPGQVPNSLYFYPPVGRNPQTFEVFVTQQL